MLSEFCCFSWFSLERKVNHKYFSYHRKVTHNVGVLVFWFGVFFKVSLYLSFKITAVFMCGKICNQGIGS